MYDSGSRKLGPLDRAERTFFGVVYLVQRDVVTSTLFYVAAVIQGLAVASAAYSPQFHWSSRVADGTGISAAMRVVSLNTLAATDMVLECMLAAAMVLVVVTAGLTAFTGYSVSQGSVPPQRVSRVLQKLIGVQVALQSPITTTLVRGLTYQCSDDPAVACGAGAGAAGAVLFAGSLVALSVHVSAVLLFSRMHSYNPRSHDSTARAVTWVDCVYSVVQISIAILFRLDIGSATAQAVYYLVANGAMAVLVTATMPFYHLPMTSLRVGIHSALAWTGACLVAVAAVADDENDIASTVFVTGVVPVAVRAYRMAADRGAALKRGGRARGQELLRRAERPAGGRARYSVSVVPPPELSAAAASAQGSRRRAGDAEDPREEHERLVGGAAEFDDLLEPVPLDKLAEHVSCLADDSVMETTVEALRAAACDAGARSLLDAATEPSEEDVAGADLYYREALTRFPRSEFLLMRYIEFLLVFRDNATLANMLVSRCSALSWGSSATRFDSFRFVRDMQMRREQAGTGHRAGTARSGRRMDVITHEEVLKTLKRTRKDHAACNKVIDKTWRALASRNATPSELTAMVEHQFELQERALERYEFLVEQVPNNMQVNTRLASFFEEVMMDPEAARAVRDEIEASRQEAAGGGGTSGRDSASNSVAGDQSDCAGGAPSSVGRASSAKWQNAVKRLSSMKEVKAQRDAALRRHALKMRAATLLLLGAIVAAVVVYLSLYVEYRDTLLNLNDSGVRRALVTLCGVHARSMHLAAPAAAADGGDTAAFDGFAATLAATAANLLRMHLKLVHDFSYGDDGGKQATFYGKPGVPYVVASETPGVGTVDTMLTGADSIVMFVQDAQAVAAYPASSFAAFNASEPSTFPELFNVLRNSPPLSAPRHEHVPLPAGERQPRASPPRRAGVCRRGRRAGRGGHRRAPDSPGRVQGI